MMSHHIEQGTLTMAETFSGIGGWSLAAKMAGGIKTIWHSEIDKNKIAIYEKNHPGVPNLGDIERISNPPKPDILTVSFPCTGISLAGKGNGLEDVASRLWFEAARIIGEIRPKYITIENGPALTIRGLDRVLESLAGFGYDAEWSHLSGTQFGIQQRRKRLYLIAYTNEERQQRHGTPFLFLKTETRVGQLTSSIYPGWRTRRDIPEPRTIGSAYDFPGLIHRLEGTGDAIIPVIGCYILECIKRHHYEQKIPKL